MVLECRLEDNTAYNSGGGLYIGDCDTVTIDYARSSQLGPGDSAAAAALTSLAPTPCTSTTVRSHATMRATRSGVLQADSTCSSAAASS